MPIWVLPGSRTSKAGFLINIGKYLVNTDLPFELYLFQIEKVIVQIRNCSMKRAGDSPMFQKLVEKIKETKDQERAAQLQKAEQLLTNDSNCNNGNDTEKESSKDEPPVKKVKSGAENDKKTDAKSPEKKDGEASQKEQKQPPFNEEKYLRRMDKWCENCRKEMPDPKPSELVMFLHAVKFKVWAARLPITPMRGVLNVHLL